MTDRINLTQLRADAFYWRDDPNKPPPPYEPVCEIAPETLLALIDAVEAARQYKRTGSRTDEMYLYDALDRFDHT